jgi:DMSO reductase anchor subunit
MFDVKSDERMNAIQTRAGFIALLCYWGAVWTLGTLMLNIEGGVLHDPHFVLAIPFVISMFVFMALHIGKDFFRTIREEAHKSPKQTRETRLRLLLGIVLFAVTMFLMRRFNIFDDDAATIGSDLLATCFITAGFGGTMWFFQARKMRGRGE